MKLSIEYCSMWNYLPKAAGLADAIQQELNINAELIKGSGGIFDVIADGKMVFSKKEIGRFPEDDEVINAIKAMWTVLDEKDTTTDSYPMHENIPGILDQLKAQILTIRDSL